MISGKLATNMCGLGPDFVELKPSIILQRLYSHMSMLLGGVTD